jgi:nucleoside-diphosphate-sugar epimerase
MEKRTNGFEEKKVIITGGLGFIGSNLAHRLIDLGATVTLIDNLNPEYGGNFFNIREIKDSVYVNISDVRFTNNADYSTLSLPLKH